MSDNQYDYIVIGAGSAGCVVAAGLIKRTQARVLLLEAGGNDNHLFIKMPAGVAKIIAKKTWPYETEPEPHANQRRMMVAQGKVIGGSSSVNGMIYLRGHREDYDAWADKFGCTGWSYSDVLPYFRRAESNESLSDRYHGTRGMLPVSENRYRHPLSMAFVRAGQELNLPYKNDFNGENQKGVGFYQTTTYRGERASTSQTYLKSVRASPNLKVITQALVHRILIEGNRATGVIFSVGDRQEQRAYARTEVILSAGAIGSPKVLMLSGIGPSEHLNSLGIRPVADLPVGKNFHDHLHMSINATTRDPITLFGADTGLRAIRHGAEWLAFRSGVISSNVLEGAAFIDSKRDGRPDVQIHFLPILDGWDDVPGEPLPQVHGLTLKVGYLQPEARGEVLLNSADPRDRVKLHANYLGHPEDLAASVRAVRAGLEFLQTEAMKPLVKEILMPSADYLKDQQSLEAFVRNFCKTVYHPVGTCRMGSDPQTSVTDLQLRVHGIAGLRVVDCSVFPRLPSGNTNAPTIMVAEKAVDLILGSAPAGGDDVRTAESA